MKMRTHVNTSMFLSVVGRVGGIWSPSNLSKCRAQVEGQQQMINDTNIRGLLDPCCLAEWKLRDRVRLPR